MSVRKFVTVVLLLLTFTANASVVNLDQLRSGAIGEYLRYFQEQEQKLSLQQAQDIFENGQVKQGQGQALSMGIGPEPVWLSTDIINTNSFRPYRITIESPWLDFIDLYLISPDGEIQHVVGGDHLNYLQQHMPHKYFAFETQFPIGTTQMFIRIQTESVMPLPIKIASVSAAQRSDVVNGYQYGFLYGVLLSLALYNGLLFFSIKQKEFGLYAAYLIGFVMNSLSYTGVIHTVIVGDFGMLFQDYVNEFLMISYSTLGLLFAVTVLNTKQYAYKLYKITLYIAFCFPVAMFVAALFNQVLITTVLSFVLNMSFVSLFIVLAIYGVLHKVEAAKLFLIASVTAASCVGISTAAVAGLIPYNAFTFKAIEIGMAFEAIMLAILLAQRFRKAQVDKQVAEYYAHTDELTSLNNRRGFTELAEESWYNVVQEQNDASILLIDLDKFKRINDKYGHATGDIVLINSARAIEKVARETDIIARWGGEEFILLLPNTSQQEALIIAEQLRVELASVEVSYFEDAVPSSASIGVCGSANAELFGEKLAEYSIEQLINFADRALYQAKLNGRNRVSSEYAGIDEATTEPVVNL